MGSNISRTVELKISNNTQTITLMNPRTYFKRGRCSKPPLPELFPRSSDTCSFWGDSESEGLAGILVFEAESFTLAIHFSNPIDHNKSSMNLALELSPGKAHLGDLEATFSRMANGTYSSSDRDIEFVRIIVGKNHGTARLSRGPVKVMAAMSYGTSSTLKVVLEEEKESGEEAETEKLWDVKGARFKRNEILRDLLRQTMDSLGLPESPADSLINL